LLALEVRDRESERSVYAGSTSPPAVAGQLSHSWCVTGSSTAFLAMVAAEDIAGARKPLHLSVRTLPIETAFSAPGARDKPDGRSPRADRSRTREIHDEKRTLSIAGQAALDA
jgi:hypothetical protein